VNRLKTFLVWYLAIAMFMIGVTPKCFAGFSPSEVIALSQGERAQDLQQVQKFLEGKMVRERLKDLGFTPEEIQLKLNQFSDQQIHQLAVHLEEMRLAGDGAEVVIIFLLIAALIVLVIYMSGHKIIVK